ncbi:MAG: undecaprenyldiphospho-muramoylpentapeptide beta-N-acetylglucosaminyltransferase [Muribaculaceae bacterium]|nr:undecaprenyldiphospho-muramoylpentapeptide beta-N-acetylglucosaminyltransferase [Muribaculaceae bacterium]
MDSKNQKDSIVPLRRVIISGGGTGGHIFPAISIANALRRRFPEVDILFVGADNRMEMERVPAAGYPIKGLTICGFDRKNIFRNISVLFKLRKAMTDARSIIKSFSPQIVIGVGGYASGPTLKAAQKLRIPTLLQEQNSYAGVTNKLLAKKARRICVAYEGMERFFPAESIVMTGNPVRKGLTDITLSQAEAKTQLGFDPDKPLVLFVGGSLGARTINESVAASLDNFIAAGIQVLWQTGKNYDGDARLRSFKDNSGVKATPFISDMDVVYRAADLVVSRAGAGSISELQSLGKAVVLVPSPNVAEDHQRKNALALVRHNAAVMIEDAECRAKLADTVISLIGDVDRRKTLSDNISRMALKDSDEHIVDTIIDIINSENK